MARISAQIMIVLLKTSQLNLVIQVFGAWTTNAKGTSRRTYSPAKLKSGVGLAVTYPLRGPRLGIALLVQAESRVGRHPQKPRDSTH